MIKVTQTWLGGIEAPVDGHGNCFQACVASVLEIPLEVAFNHGVFGDNEWFEEFNKWLKQYGLACIFVECSEKKPLPSTPLRGIHIAEMETKSGVKHAVVVRGDMVVHDPFPNSWGTGDCCGLYFFVPLNPMFCRRMI